MYVHLCHDNTNNSLVSSESVVQDRAPRRLSQSINPAMAYNATANLVTLPPEVCLCHSLIVMSVPLTDLQILLQIHYAAKNPALALVSTSIHAFLSPPYVTPSYIAKYLIELYSSSRTDAILVKALRHPVCTVAVAESLKRIWDDRRGYIPPRPEEAKEKEDKAKRKDDSPVPREGEGSSPPSSPPPRRPTKPPLTTTELPRRLFRHLATDSTIPPLLEYLFANYPQISPNSHNGYPLSRAVLCQNKEVIAYLLSHGADPGLRDGLAVEIAVKMGNIKLVRLLVDNPQSKVVDITPRFVELAVRSGSDEIVQYFVHDKGELMYPDHHAHLPRLKHELIRTRCDAAIA